MSQPHLKGSEIGGGANVASTATVPLTAWAFFASGRSTGRVSELEICNTVHAIHQRRALTEFNRLALARRIFGRLEPLQKLALLRIFILDLDNGLVTVADIRSHSNVIPVSKQLTTPGRVRR